MPGVHPAVHDGVVHRVAHGEPVDDEVDVLDVSVADDGRLKVLNDEVCVLRQPAERKDDDDRHHHLYHLHTHTHTHTHYRAVADYYLQRIIAPLACDSCEIGCHDEAHLNYINAYYDSIVSALYCASNMCVPRIPCNSLKPYWNMQMDQLKADSVFWHNMWISAGRPATGVLQHIRLSCKAKYKLGIRNAYFSFEDKLTDEMCHHFNNKNIPEFWKS